MSAYEMRISDWSSDVCSSDLNGQVPEAALPVTYGLLLNLVGVMGAEATEEQVWAYLGNYVEDARADKYPELAGLIRNALAYNRDFIAPTLLRRKPEGVDVAALERLDRELAALAPAAAAAALQKSGRAPCAERVGQN